MFPPEGHKISISAESFYKLSKNSNMRNQMALEFIQISLKIPLMGASLTKLKPEKLKHNKESALPALYFILLPWHFSDRHFVRSTMGGFGIFGPEIVWVPMRVKTNEMGSFTFQIIISNHKTSFKKFHKKFEN